MFDILDPIIKQYNLPPWVKLYVGKYIKKNPQHAISRAFGFVNYKRKKGAIKKGKIILPNKFEFDADVIAKISEVFLYGNVRLSEIALEWSKRTGDPYSTHYSKISEAYASDGRAINSLITGLRRKTEFEPTRELAAVFEYLRSIDNVHMRLIAIDLIIKYAYAKTFGAVFFKAFYPVSPEFMRQLKSVLNYNSNEFSFGEAEAKRIINENLISHDMLMESAEHLLFLIYSSIGSEMPIAKNAGIDLEISLLRDVSIAYPLHVLSELGVDINPDAEAEKIFTMYT